MSNDNTFLYSKEGYHHWYSPSGYAQGSFEVFWKPPMKSQGEPGGWYWWACFPGCLPDGEATGPFSTSLDAYNDAIGDDNYPEAA